MRWNSANPSENMIEREGKCHGTVVIFLFHFFAAQGSRSKTEFIGFADRRARTEPGPGPLFHFLPSQGSRSKTELIGFADRCARTEPGPGPLFHFLPAQGSRSKTEFIGFADRRARTKLSPALALQNNKPASGSNSLTMSLAEHAIRLPPGDTSRILRSCQPGWPSLACSFSSSSWDCFPDAGLFIPRCLMAAFALV